MSNTNKFRNPSLSGSVAQNSFSSTGSISLNGSGNIPSVLSQALSQSLTQSTGQSDDEYQEHQEKKEKSTSFLSDKSRSQLSQPSQLSQVAKKEKSLTETHMFSGEKINKSDKIISAIGSIEELISYIGIIKAEHFNPSSERKFDIANSSKVLFFGKLTQIQECLLDIIISLGTVRTNGKHELSKFPSTDDRVRDLETHIEDMKRYSKNTNTEWPSNPNSILPGTSVLETHIFHSRVLCRRAERQVIASKNLQSGMIPEDSILNYLNKLGEYLFSLSIHSLHLYSKEPMKRTGKNR